MSDLVNFLSVYNLEELIESIDLSSNYIMERMSFFSPICLLLGWWLV